MLDGFILGKEQQCCQGSFLGSLMLLLMTAWSPWGLMWFYFWTSNVSFFFLWILLPACKSTFCRLLTNLEIIPSNDPIPTWTLSLSHLLPCVSGEMTIGGPHGTHGMSSCTAWQHQFLHWCWLYLDYKFITESESAKVVVYLFKNSFTSSLCT